VDAAFMSLERRGSGIHVVSRACGRSAGAVLNKAAVLAGPGPVTASTVHYLNDEPWQKVPAAGTEDG
jgi:hypothetical protein